MHSLKNPNHINKISYMLPEKWLPNLYVCPSLIMVGLCWTLHEKRCPKKMEQKTKLVNVPEKGVM